MNTFTKELNDIEFNKLSSFIYSNYGIKMPYAKKSMLQARLQSRLRETGKETFKEYCDHVFSSSDDLELVHMIDVVSTNKTDFFREAAHFDFMQSVILPEYKEEQSGETMNIWSSACSSGEEVYTIAMAIEEFLEDKKRFNYSIHGTDISSRVLQKAQNGVYQEERIANIPMALKKKYFLRSKLRENPKVKVVKELIQKTSYQRLNLMDPSYNVHKIFDVIFCRNVLIYFDRKTQEEVINKLCTHLKPNGYLFLGHSESITGINVPLKQLKPTIYRKATN
ncbi:MAG: CheR family methyltransferase [Bacteroidota bacterium]